MVAKQAVEPFVSRSWCGSLAQCLFVPNSVVKEMFSKHAADTSLHSYDRN
jgi:hypothetical protein